MLNMEAVCSFETVVLPADLHVVITQKANIGDFPMWELEISQFSKLYISL
jgi:hypothetical protein